MNPYSGNNMLNPQHKLFRWGPISACPLFMYFNIEPAFAPLKNQLGVCFPESTILFWENKVLWLLDNQEFSDRSREFTEKNVFDKENRKRYFKLWKDQNSKLMNMLKRLDTIEFNQLSTDKLVELYRNFSKAYYDWFTITISLELATVTLEPLLGEKLKVQYKHADQKRYAHAFSVLTSPLVLTFYRQEQRDLLTILTLPKNEQEGSLKKHQQKYYWIYNSYLEGKTLDISHFRAELRKAKNTDYKKTLREIQTYPESIKQEKQKILSKFHSDRNFLELISLVETFSALQDERKMFNFKAEHYLQKFVDTFSRKAHIDASSLKLLVLDELSDVIQAHNKQRIDKRKTCFIVNCTDREITHYDRPNALIIANQFLGVQNINQTIIQGTVASTGVHPHFRGTAKIILTIDEIGKVKTGDILVTTMTSPDFVIGMKKAGAIITDTGGMLSHAAIVSREFKIPCIVGTEIATKVIHDGDVVELHCGKGTVRIIKRGINL